LRTSSGFSRINFKSNIGICQNTKLQNYLKSNNFTPEILRNELLKKQTASSTFFTISFCEKAKNNCRGNSQIAPKKLSRYNVADVANIVGATGRSPAPIGSAYEVHFGNQVIYVGYAI
jgi:hypothetical protein